MLRTLIGLVSIQQGRRAVLGESGIAGPMCGVGGDFFGRPRSRASHGAQSVYYDVIDISVQIFCLNCIEDLDQDFGVIC